MLSEASSEGAEPAAYDRHALRSGGRTGRARRAVVPPGGVSFGFSDAQRSLHDKEACERLESEPPSAILQAYLERERDTGELSNRLRDFAVARVSEARGTESVEGALAHIFGVAGDDHPDQLVQAAAMALSKEPLERRFAFWAQVVNAKPRSERLAGAIDQLAAEVWHAIRIALGIAATRP